MAKHTQVLLIDDIDGGEAHETVRFGIGDTMNLEIDLHRDKARKLREALAPFIGKARLVVPEISRGRRSHRARSGSGGGPKMTRAESQAIREWAKANNYPVSERGRIAANIVEAYEAAGAPVGILHSNLPKHDSPAPPAPKPDPMAQYRPNDNDDEKEIKAKFRAWLDEFHDGLRPRGKQYAKYTEQWLEAVK